MTCGNGNQAIGWDPARTAADLGAWRIFARQIHHHLSPSRARAEDRGGGGAGSPWRPRETGSPRLRRRQAELHPDCSTMFLILRRSSAPASPHRGARVPAAAPTAGGLSRTCSARPRRVEIGEDHGEIEDGGGRQGQGLQHPELNMRLFHKILEVSCRFLNCDCVASIHVYKLQLKKLELGHAAIPKIIEARMQFSVKCCQLTVCFILQFWNDMATMAASVQFQFWNDIFS